jgi:hypothetical protein
MANKLKMNIIMLIVTNFFFMVKKILEKKLNRATINNGIVNNSPKNRIAPVDLGG